MTTKEMLMMILPLLAINFIVLFIALRMWFKYGVRNLNKWAWLAIILVVNTFGPILFMIIGKGENTYVEEDFDFKS